MGKTYRGDFKKQQKDKYRTEREKRQGKRRVGDDEPKEKRDDKNDRDERERNY